MCPFDQLPYCEIDERYTAQSLGQYILCRTLSPLLPCPAGGRPGGQLTDDNHSIVNEPVLSVPRRIGRVAVASNNHDHPHQANVRAVWLEPAIVGERTTVDALCNASSVEEDECDG